MRVVEVYWRCWDGRDVLVLGVFDWSLRVCRSYRGWDIRHISEVSNYPPMPIFENLKVVRFKIINRLAVLGNDGIHLNQVGGDPDGVFLLTGWSLLRRWRCLRLDRWWLNRWRWVLTKRRYK